jgi:cell wall-associated NlpC family hydrolase
LLVTAVIASAVVGVAGFTGTMGTATGGSLAPDSVPAAFSPWVIKAGALCPQQSPAVIAAQLWVESGFNVDAISSAGARGPAQFMPATWGAWGRDEDGDGTASPGDIADAVMAQGRLMCALMGAAARSGFPGDTVSLALAGYNAGWGAVQQYGGIPPYPETTGYVQRVLAKAEEFAAPAAPTGVGGPVGGVGVGADAVRRAAAWVGTPYVYGGGTPAGPTVGFCDGSYGLLDGRCFASRHVGFDCSSLVQLGWWPTVRLPRTAAGQYAATSAHPVPLTALQPGDLIFYSRGRGIDHVAMYYDTGKIIEAPSTGQSVRVVDLDAAGVLGATRPGATSAS